MMFVFEENPKDLDMEIVELQSLLNGRLGALHEWRTGVVTNVQREVPVGSIKFVESVLGHRMRPIEVPHCLRKPEFLKREYNIVPYDALPITGKWFIKDASVLKDFPPHAMDGSDIKFNLESLHTNFNYDKGVDVVDKEYQKHSYVVSEPVKFQSEWRVLVCDGDVVACLCYMGDTLAFPDADMIRDMVGLVSRDKRLPLAYTLDVGVSGRGTHIIEMHNFVSCGTYGYSGEDLVWMYQKGFLYELGGGYNEEPGK